MQTFSSQQQITPLTASGHNSIPVYLKSRQLSNNYRSLDTNPDFEEKHNQTSRAQHKMISKLEKLRNIKNVYVQREKPLGVDFQRFEAFNKRFVSSTKLL